MFIRLDYPEDELWLLELQIQRKVPHNEFFSPGMSKQFKIIGILPLINRWIIVNTHLDDPPATLCLRARAFPWHFSLAIEIRTSAGFTDTITVWFDLVCFQRFLISQTISGSQTLFQKKSKNCKKCQIIAMTAMYKNVIKWIYLSSKMIENDTEKVPKWYKNVRKKDKMALENRTRWFQWAF